ncbi:MAG TPA: TonB-dependent receptor [Chitinophagaceae bacterium]|nr:TonB-dependent receptor [Chitinophagaceae bacterium]
MHNSKLIGAACLAFVLYHGAAAQQNPARGRDSAGVRSLDSVILNGYRQAPSFLPDLDGVDLFAGKRTSLLVLDPSQGNLSQGVVRSLFAKVPGLTTWDMDGAGTQINIGFRGTDAHRSIEMNMRQNGYNTNSDIFGYPEDHYTPPLQGVQQVQIVRGSAALQYGSQFGGMLNYIMKQGDTTRPVSLYSEQTLGSHNLFNSFNSAGGKSGRWRYYAYYDNRHGDGWRPNSAFEYHALYADVAYQLNDRGQIHVQFSRMDYRQQIAGGLTDAQFAADPRLSLRSRNYFSPEINIPALILTYGLSARTRLQVTAHSLLGQRNSVQFLRTADIPDTVNRQTGTYNPRQVDRDYYRAFTTEARLLHTYRIGGLASTLSGGLRYFDEITRRRQQGVGSTGADFDLALVAPYGIDLRFHTRNYAAFAENLLQVTPRFSVTPGVRFEVIRTNLTGVISQATLPVNYLGRRSFPLFGTGLQYQLSGSTQLYGNLSQAYRPYLYANVTPADQLGRIDPNMKDSRGYDIDLGYRGELGRAFRFDLNLFQVYYGNRVGQLSLRDANNREYLYTTNVGDAMTRGLEAYGAVSLPALLHWHAAGFDLRMYNSLALNHGRYLSGEINKGGTNISLDHHYLEGTPTWIERAGLTYQYQTFSTTLQYSYVGRSFSDANNTLFSATGATGLVPAYQVWDLSAGWKIRGRYQVSGGINNLADARYFSRRINMYPGPGILPADGRTCYISLGITI